MIKVIYYKMKRIDSILRFLYFIYNQYLSRLILKYHEITLFQSLTSFNHADRNVIASLKHLCDILYIVHILQTIIVIIIIAGMMLIVIAYEQRCNAHFHKRINIKSIGVTVSYYSDNLSAIT